LQRMAETKRNEEKREMWQIRRKEIITEIKKK
jgi:hypothetical protein